MLPKQGRKQNASSMNELSTISRLKKKIIKDVIGKITMMIKKT